MQALISLHGLRLRAIIGVLAHERRRPQPLLIDVECRYDIAAAARSDALHDTLDYREIAACIDEVARNGRFELLEALGWQAATALRARFPTIAAITLTLRKPRALRHADWAAIQVRLPND